MSDATFEPCPCCYYATGPDETPCPSRCAIDEATRRAERAEAELAELRAKLAARATQSLPTDWWCMCERLNAAAATACDFCKQPKPVQPKRFA